VGTTDAVEISELVRAGSLSPGKAVDAAIARAEATNPVLNAIVEIDYDAARARAEAVARDGLLAGVPTLLKDLGAPLEGDRGYRGNRVLREMDYRYRYTGNVARRLTAAGAVSLGRSHSPELGSGNCPAAAETALYGPCRNPWDLGRTPLGSSGGAAAAVAAGIVPIAHASDGGGSIRLPASACGVVGLKPSRGRISIAPEGENWAGGATDGVISRTVRDTALGLDVLVGWEPGDPHQATAHVGTWLGEVGVDPGQLRVRLCDSLPFASTDPECQLAVSEAGELLASLGHHVDVDHPAGMDTMDFMYDYVRVIRASAAAGLDALAEAFGRPVTADDVEEGTWITAQRGRKISAPDYVASLARIHTFSRSIVAWWHDVDLLVTPTVARIPPPVGHLVEGDLKQRTSRLAEITPFVTLFNVTGQPAISLPLHWTPDGVPIGVQLVSAPDREDVLLRVAAQLEAAAPWIDREPVLPTV
jgi:amidase